MQLSRSVGRSGDSTAARAWGPLGPLGSGVSGRGECGFREPLGDWGPFGGMPHATSSYQTLRNIHWWHTAEVGSRYLPTFTSLSL